MRERARRWYAENPEKVAEKYERDRDSGAAAERARKWYYADRMRALAVAHNARASRMGASGRVTGEQLQRLWDKHEGRCYMCGSEAVGFDHVKALSRGGRNTIRNMRPSCNPCNSKKGAKPLLEVL